MNRPHKKTTSKDTKDKKTLSPRLPRARREQPAATGERETSATPSNDQAQQVAAAWTAARSGRRNPAAEREVRASAAELLTAGWPVADLIALAQDMAAKFPTGRNLARHADHWQPVRPVAPPAAPSALPAACTDCLAADPAAEYNPKFRTRHDKPCPACHPNAVPAAA